VGIERELMFTGGIAKNIGIVRRLEQQIKLKIKTSFEPQIVGALGAALFAQETLEKVCNDG
jgi:activator of 2-hydroxyglutaryl-CoA dehydratase